MLFEGLRSGRGMEVGSKEWKKFWEDYMYVFNADFREPLTFLISAHLRALSVPTFGVIVELRCINAGTDKSIHGGSYAR